MNGKGFLKEINNLDDDLIMEAAEAARTGRTGRNIIKFAGMAACVAIFTGVITASVLIEKQKMEKENAGEAAVESSYEMGEKQDNMLEGAAEPAVMVTTAVKTTRKYCALDEVSPNNP